MLITPAVPDAGLPKRAHACTAPRGALVCTQLATLTGRPRRLPICRRYRAQRKEWSKRWLLERRFSGLMRLAYRGSAQWYILPQAALQ